MNKTELYIAHCAERGFRRVQVDPPLSRLMRLFIKDFPPVMALPVFSVALILGLNWGAMFYPTYIFLMKMMGYPEAVFVVRHYLLVIAGAPLIFGLPVALMTKW